MMAQSALINVIFRASEKAARGLVRDFGEVENLQITRKGVADFVSNADTDAEKAIMFELKKARPDWGFIMEEGGIIPPQEPDGPSWIIDPLDGTTNYLHGIPHFAISIAAIDKPLAKGGKVIAGGIFDPMKNEFFFAEPGKGAFLNDRRIRVAGRRNMADGLFATGIPFMGRGNDDDHNAFLNEMREVMATTSGVRRMGSAALDLAWVAAGRYDGFWEHGLSVWDIAAGVLIVREAGGFVSDFASRDRALTSGDVVAGNPQTHSGLRKTLKAGRDRA
ncbi:MAG: inositol monophosphatase [Alphaproteobacteria bacterium]|nr:inositol monophosphatase [Alphaproteobacteria bacterium]